MSYTVSIAWEESQNGRNQFKIEVCFVKMICFPLVARETTSRAAALYLFLRFFQLYLITTILDYVVGNAVVVLGKLSSVNMPGYRGFVTAGSQGRGVSGLSSPAWSRTMLLSPGPISKALASSLVIKLQKC